MSDTDTFANEYERQWPTGYAENFEVYENQIGLKEREIVEKAMDPYQVYTGVALEVGCGNGAAWSKKHLLPRFKWVKGIDVIRREWVSAQVIDERFSYEQVPVGDYSCYGIADESVDFVWCFGVFCHLPWDGVVQYLKSIYRVLKPTRFATFEFAATERRCQLQDNCDDPLKPNWTVIGTETVNTMLRQTGFVSIVDHFPNSKALIVTVQKP